MQYPLPVLPPTLCFQGSATFFLGQNDAGESDVTIRCDATGRVVCWSVAPSVQLRFAGIGDTVASCSGTLEDGRPFSLPELRAVTWPSDGLPTPSIAWLAQKLVIGQELATMNCEFALTNLLLPNFNTDGLPASLALGPVTATLTALSDYAERMRYLRAYKGTDVTATLGLVATTPGEDLSALTQDLCLIMSVLTGHKVNWVSRKTDSALVFENRVTKPCCGWPVMGRLDKVLGKDWNWRDLLAHTLNCVPSFRQRAANYALREGLIDSWIDARIATDFLEARCLKTVAVLEVIKSAYRDHHQAKGTFLDLLDEVHKDLAISAPSADLEEIKNLRNQIVHEGTFLSPPDTTKSEVEQYEMLSHYCDRLMLSLTGHSV